MLSVDQICHFTGSFAWVRGTRYGIYITKPDIITISEVQPRRGTFTLPKTKTKTLLKLSDVDTIVVMDIDPGFITAESMVEVAPGPSYRN